MCVALVVQEEQRARQDVDPEKLGAGSRRFALGYTPGKHAKSAEVQERKGDALRSGAKECAQRAKESIEGGDRWRCVLEITT